MYDGHHLAERCCLLLSRLFIDLCRKGECKACHCLCWLADWGWCSQKGLCCTHKMWDWSCSSMPRRRLQKPSELPKSSIWPSQDSCPHSIWPLNIKNHLKIMSGLAFNDTQVVYHHMNCALWCMLLLRILHQHFACLTWWVWASALSHFLCASWSCSLQSVLLQSLLFAFLLSTHPCIIWHISYSNLSIKTPRALKISYISRAP